MAPETIHSRSLMPSVGAALLIWCLALALFGWSRPGWLNAPASFFVVVFGDTAVVTYWVRRYRLGYPAHRAIRGAVILAAVLTALLALFALARGTDWNGPNGPTI